jgi:hypothetical protein
MISCQLNLRNPQLTTQLLDAAGYLIVKRPSFYEKALQLFIAFFKDNPYSSIWDITKWNQLQRSGHGMGQFCTTLAEQKTIHLLDQPVAIELSHDYQKYSLISDISSTFRFFLCFLQSHEEAEKYTHAVLSHLIELRKKEGLAAAESKLKAFVAAFAFNPEAVKYTFGLVSRGVHLDQNPISNCCKHLPITDDFKLTPIILKTLIAEFATKHIPWNFYIIHRIETEEQACALIEAAAELPIKQKEILLSSFYYQFASSKKIDIRKLFKEKLNIDNLQVQELEKMQPVCPHADTSAYNMVFV